MKRNSLFAGVTAAACLIACDVDAQSAGVFTGTSDDGQFISVTVTKSGSTYTVTNMSVNFAATCKHTGLTDNDSWGFYLGDDISGGSLNFSTKNHYYDMEGSMQFAGKLKIKGKITTYEAVFVPGPMPPKQSQFCISAKQDFLLTKSPEQFAPVVSNISTNGINRRR